jgi:NAD+ synthase/NAD+ synthase (glutamine-hydrolysing)
MRIALGQINTTVGDLPGNLALMVRLARTAAERGAELAVFPELSLTGYPPRDLVEKRSFPEQSERALQQLADETRNLPLAIVSGYVGRSQESTGKRATNSAAILQGGRILLRQTKLLLPTYDVFDDSRNFVPGHTQSTWALGTENLALTICEDSWNDKLFWPHRLYSRDPVDELMQQGGSLLISVNASPFHLGKRELRREMFRAIVRRHRVPAIVVNQVGGNDQVVFDGSSFAMDQDGNVIASAASFREDLVIVDTAARRGDEHTDLPDETEAVYEALVLGTRDYIRKCGFAKVLIGLSGGIDSSLTAVVAVDAVGRENVRGVAMPGPYSSDHSVRDAKDMAERLGIPFDIVSITPAYDEMVRTLAPVFEGRKPDVAEENIQARLRGLTLMSLSNKFGAMVLTTGNKSEIAVGYCTLYGDMCGGLAVISDVPKTMVYDLSRIANKRHAGAIPESVFEKPPSAELRPDQKDSDSLPAYEVLDAILRLYVEEMQSPAEIAAELAIELDLVKDVARKVDRNEYKRQQAAPGLKVTSKAFGIGRRFPIAQRYQEEGR